MNSITRIAFTHRCPACGVGSLYSGVLRVAPECSHCHQSFAGADSGDGPAFFVILIVGFLVCVLAGVAEVVWGWPLWMHALVWIPFTLISSVWLLRVCKSALLAWQYKVAQLGEGGES